jgi:hypothetical protein
VITDVMVVQAAPGLLGIHTNMPGAIPPEIDGPALPGTPAPAGLSGEEKSTREQLAFFYKYDFYGFWMASHPQTMNGLADSRPSCSTTLIARAFDGQEEGLSRDDVLDNITLLWLTNAGVSSEEKSAHIQNKRKIRSPMRQHRRYNPDWSESDLSVIRPARCRQSA